MFKKKSSIVFVVFLSILLNSCSSNNIGNKKDFITLFADSQQEDQSKQNYPLVSTKFIIKNQDGTDKKTKLVDRAFKIEKLTKYSRKIISNIYFSNNYIYFVDGSQTLNQYSTDDLQLISKVKIKLNRLEKQKLSKFFISADKNFVYILTDFGKLFTMSSDSLTQEYTININNSFNSKPVSDGFYIYLKSSNNYIYSLYSNNGKVFWKYTADPKEVSVNQVGDLIIHQNYLIVPISPFKNIILNKLNGDLVSINDESKNEEDFKIKSIKQADLFMFDNKMQNITTLSTINQTNSANIYEDDLTNLYTIDNNLFIHTDLKSSQASYTSNINQIIAVTNFTNGFVILNHFGNIFFIDPIQKTTKYLFTFDSKKNNATSLQSFENNMFIATKYGLYAVSQKFEPLLIKPMLLRKGKKSKQISFDEPFFVYNYKERLYVFDDGKIYKSITE